MPSASGGKCTECGRWFASSMGAPGMPMGMQPQAGTTPYASWTTPGYAPHPMAMPVPIPMYHPYPVPISAHPHPHPHPPHPSSPAHAQIQVPVVFRDWRGYAPEPSHSPAVAASPIVHLPTPAPSSGSAPRPRKRRKKNPAGEEAMKAVPRPYVLPDPRAIPKPVVVPYATAHGPPPEPIKYQTLSTLLQDLNRLVCTPHEGREFHFVGTYTIVAEVFPDVEQQAKALEERVRDVAWEVCMQTVVDINVPALKIKSFAGSRGKLETTLPTAMAAGVSSTPWTFTGISSPPCPHCTHALSIHVTRLSQRELDAVPGWARGRHGALLKEKETEEGRQTLSKVLRVGAERVVIGLRHSVPEVAAPSPAVNGR
uniref:Uncharacterized protein n=1 Tax=Mycena chlorophos TaxID=658473 RepID=A0ABQ0L0P4_MYCCL|nr:predicted protein [Mycena chlorophos]